MKGLEHIQNTFAKMRVEGRVALMPYFTMGYPNLEESLNILEAMANSGADLIEIGVPFSDPLADGPTIQRSTQIALEQGTTMVRCLELVHQLRRRGVRQPLLLMGYINPILSYGIERFVTDASGAGVDGFIVPDLPPEEAAQLETACAANGRALVYLVAPTSTEERIALIAARSTGFVYLVSVIGVTGARKRIPNDLARFVQRVRATTDKPLAVGFGISTPEQARQVGEIADGVIVGSALIDATERSDDPVAAVSSFIQGMRIAMEGEKSIAIE